MVRTYVEAVLVHQGAWSRTATVQSDELPPALDEPAPDVAAVDGVEGAAGESDDPLDDPDESDAFEESAPFEESDAFAESVELLDAPDLADPARLSVL
jgi:hypothetical protein